MQRQLTKVLAMAVSMSTLAAHGAEPAQDYPIRPVPAHQVQFQDAFWWPRLEVNRTATIPVSFQMCEETGRIENFKVAGGLSDAKWVGTAGFNDSDVFKVMEGAAYSLMTHPDPRLRAYLDELIGWVAAAQEEDGYLFTSYTARDRIAEGPQHLRCCYPREGKKWLSLRDSHELYNVGHMYEAAIAHWQATGNKRFLNIATKNADMLVETFGPGKVEIPPGHQEIELALVKLYRATGEPRYLKLAMYLIDLRGTPSDERPELWGEYTQDHKPLIQQDEAVGHAVRAMYFYAGATDIAALAGDRSIIAALDRLWESVFARKAYITGAIGSTRQGEAFGKDYELPNDTAYAETCANLATCFWNHRMFLLHGDAKYIDMLERALYNGVVSGVALDGKTFFYPNPLAASGNYSRSKWFDCACCPSNLCRFIPSVPGYVYATRGDTVYVNLFVAGTAELNLDSGKLRIEQETNYPWDGRITIKLTPEKAGQNVELRVRIPGWVENKPFPTDLYAFADDPPAEGPRLLVNGQDVADAPRDAGYAVIRERTWQSGDTVTLELPMPVRRVMAQEKVEANRGRVALVRGPIVYCLEGPDVPGGEVANLVLPDDKPLASEFRKDQLGGLQVVTGVAQRARTVAEAKPASSHGDFRISPMTEEVEVTAIPYYAWANRGPSKMAVWLPRTPDGPQAEKASN